MSTYEIFRRNIKNYQVLSFPLTQKPIPSHINIIQPSHPIFFIYSDLFLPLCRCRGLLLHLITLNDTHTHTHTHIHTLGRSSLNEGSALRRHQPDNT